MDRGKVVDEIAGYLRGDHWRRCLAALQDPDPRNAHLHIYVDTCVHPGSLEAVLCREFERRGWPSVRRIDHMSPRPGLGSLHGIEPRGKLHFDFNWSFDAGTVLAPSERPERCERGSNLLYWNRWYVEEYYRRFPFRPAGPRDEAGLTAYFKSDHWHRGLERAAEWETTNHLHFNVRTGLHPAAIQKAAEASLAAKGWRIDYVCPNVYLAEGEYRGKLVFMGREPEAVYDIGWKFDPQATIEPDLKPWIWEGNPGYDIWTKEMRDAVMRQDWLTLTDAEIEQVIARVA
jgi:hypothetical protein